MIDGATVNLTTNPLYTNLVQSIDVRKRELEAKKLEISAALLEVITDEKERVLQAQQNVADAMAIFATSDKVIDIIPALETNYTILKDAWDEVGGTTPVA
jgi:hypothetical protein